jgi:hypothetical protein
MMTELITPSELTEIEEAAAKHGVLLRLPVKEYADGLPKYGFWHADAQAWVFVIDWDWRKRRIRFHKRFIETLRQNGILASVEKGGGKNCSVEERDFAQALQLCTVGLTQPK